MRHYYLSNEGNLIRLNDFVIMPSQASTLPKEAAFEGDYVPQESVRHNRFALAYKAQPPTSPFRVVCEDFTFYDCEIVSILPTECTITGVVGNPQMTGEPQRADLSTLMKQADEMWVGQLQATE